MFADLGESAVDPAQRIVARRALIEAAATLSVAPPAIRWFDAESDGEREYAKRWGMRDWCWWPGAPDLAVLYLEPLYELCVRRGLSPMATIRAVAYGVRLTLRDGQSPEVRAIEAEAFAAKATAAFTN